jgi:hypothetical protein
VSKNKLMNRIFLALLLAGVLLAYGGEQTHDASLSVNAKVEQGQDKTEKEVRRTPKGSVVTTTVKTETETCTLEITVENQTEQKDSYQLEWFFISEKTSESENGELSIFSSGKAEVTVAGGSSVTKTEVSKPFIFINRMNAVTGSGDRNQSQQIRGGDVYAGYLVLVKASGEILQKESNDARFLTDKWLTQTKATIKTTIPVRAKKKK